MDAFDDLFDSGDQDFSGGAGISSGDGGSSNIGSYLGAAGSLAGVAGSLVSGTANTAADQASAQGYQEESQAYTQAAGYAQGNVQLAQESTAIQQYQQQRQLALTLGKQRAEVAGAGLAEGGSAVDLLKASMSQGALASGLVGVQGAINEQSYAAQAAADIGLSQQAETAGTAATNAASSSTASTALGVAGGILGVVSKIPLIGALF